MDHLTCTWKQWRLGESQQYDAPTRPSGSVHLHDLHDSAVWILYVEPEFDIVCRSEAMLPQYLGGRISVESLHADGEMIDQSWRVLLPQRHQCTVDARSARSQAQNLVDLVLADGHQTKDAAIEIG